MAKNRILQSLVALFIILVGNPFLMSCQSCTLVWMHYLKFKSSTDFSVQDISWQGCSLFWFSHLSGKVIDLWLSDRRIKWAAATNKQRVLFMSVSNFYCYSYKSELTMHRTHIEQIRWSSPKHRTRSAIEGGQGRGGLISGGPFTLVSYSLKVWPFGPVSGVR